MACLLVAVALCLLMSVAPVRAVAGERGAASVPGAASASSDPRTYPAARRLHRSGRPLVIAHRGDASEPENSLRSIREAGRRGADYAEIDVRLTADGRVVVFHDRRTGRLSASGVDLPVGKLPWRTLRTMPMISQGRHYRVPTLGQAIDAARESSPRLGLLIELKSDVLHAPRLVRGVKRAVRRRHFGGRAMVMSMNPGVVRILRKAMPRLPVGYCVHRPGPGTLSVRSDFLVVRGRWVTPALVRATHLRRRALYAGVGLFDALAGRCLRMGADGVLGGNTRGLLREVRAPGRRGGVRHGTIRRIPEGRGPWSRGPRSRDPRGRGPFPSPFPSPSSPSFPHATGPHGGPRPARRAVAG